MPDRSALRQAAAEAASPLPRRDLFDGVIAGVLAGLLVIPQVALGAIASWARLGCFLAAVALAALWIAQAAWRGRLVLRRDPVWYFLLAFWGLLLLQVIPLPAGLASRHAGVARVAELSAIRLDGGGPATISVSPYDSSVSMLRCAAYTLVLVVAAHSLRRRRDVLLLVLALIAAGTIEALFGFSQYFSGQRYPSWSAGEGRLDGVTGTFPHKNYFSGFLEMIIPVAIGLLIALGREKTGGGASGGGGVVAPGLRAAVANPASFQQLMLASGVVVMISGIVFSLCRAGVFILFATLATFLLVLLCGGAKKYALAILVIGALASLAGATIGLDAVIRGVEDAGSRQSSSWIHRLDMARHAVGIVRDFPLFGTGLGTTGQVFPRYQSSQHADLQVLYLHNDLLQLLCETGIVGGLILGGGGAWFLARMVARLRRRGEPFSRWVGTGAVLGAGAMIAHSLFEHNLGKVTSNAIVFTQLLAIGWACSRGLETGRSPVAPDSRRIDLGAPAFRAALVAGSAAVCAASLYFVIPLIKADLAANRSLAMSGPADPYFFLPVSTEHTDAKAEAQAALALAPSNHRYHYLAALQARAAAARATTRMAADLLRRETAAAADEEVRRLVRILGDDPPPRFRAARRPDLLAAAGYLDTAVRFAPAVAEYHYLRGITRLELEGPSPGAVRDAETAVRLAPSVPKYLFGAGSVFLAAGGLKQGLERDLLWEQGLGALQESLAVDPAYAQQAYPLVKRLLGVQGLIKVTPATIPAAEGLYAALWKEQRWEDALAVIRKMRRPGLARFAEQEAAVSPPRDERLDRDAPAAAGSASIGKSFDRRSPEELERSFAQREAALLGILGRRAERNAARSRYRRLLRVDSARRMHEARSLRSRGRSAEAIRQCLAVLALDWAYPAALLEAAELAALPHVTKDLPPGNEPFDHLYRLVLHEEELTPEERRRMGQLLERLVPRTAAEKVKMEFIRGAAAALGGQPEEGVRILQRLQGEFRGGDTPWDQEHLLWYCAGRGQERTGAKQDAIRSYRKALELIPSHKPSLQRLAGLGVDVSPELGRGAPEVRLDIGLGGRITLLGYSLVKVAPPAGPEAASITFFWEFRERMAGSSKPLLSIGSLTGDPPFRDRGVIMKGGAPYPLETAKSGEVVAESYPLPPQLLAGAYLRVWCPPPLVSDLGSDTAIVALR